jgi:hypothetical protein
MYFSRKLGLLVVTKILATAAVHILLNSYFIVKHLVLGVKYLNQQLDSYVRM